jgi:ABC-2 type transport system ATP-binding protein
MIIDHGRLLFDGRLDALQERFGGQRELVVDFAEQYDDPQVNCATLIHLDENRATYQFERRQIAASELIGRISAQYRIRDLSVREPEVEETIRRIYEEKLLDRPSGISTKK